MDNWYFTKQTEKLHVLYNVPFVLLSTEKWVRIFRVNNNYHWVVVLSIRFFSFSLYSGTRDYGLKSLNKYILILKNPKQSNLKDEGFYSMCFLWLYKLVLFVFGILHLIFLSLRPLCRVSGSLGMVFFDFIC